MRHQIFATIAPQDSIFRAIFAVAFWTATEALILSIGQCCYVGSTAIATAFATGALAISTTGIAVVFERDAFTRNLVVTRLTILAQHASVGIFAPIAQPEVADTLTSLDAFFTTVSYPPFVLAANTIAF